MAVTVAFIEFDHLEVASSPNVFHNNYEDEDYDV